MMDFRILGPLEVRSDEGVVDLGPPKQRAVLALLLLHVDRVVPTDRILDELWGADAGGKEKALWVHISRLRSALEPDRADRGQRSVLVTRDHGYSIRSDPDSVDAVRFERAVVEARTLIRDDPEAASALLTDALALWRGSALQDFTYEPFAGAEIARLQQLRLDAIELRIDADLRRGLSSELIGELEPLVEQHPLRDRPITQLMHALYRAGRHADALRAFQRHRRRLGDELGLEPSPELCRLEEQILLHDPRLAPPSGRIDVPAKNPFKGLLAFQEGDAGDFFGRDRLVADVVTRLDGGATLVTLVGPSGSGKSSVVRAGVIPAVNKGALGDAEHWIVASMVPGAHPFAELEAALLHAAIDSPDSLETQLADPTLGLLRAALRLLPDDKARLLLVIDQFEELFTLVDDEATRRRFLANIVAALDDPQRRLVVVLTLRADAYHHPLGYSDFAPRLASAVVNVLPLSADELEEAAEAPARSRGVALEPALLAELLTDVIGEPGALPLFQYSLTQLFDRRENDRLTLSAYRSLGGVRGALTRRAEDVYHRLSPDEQEAARQLFLRLVTTTDQHQWSRRRVPASEVVAIDVDVVTMESVIDELGRHRFLAFDRDHGTGAPTVEVAHEALLTEWERLDEWLEASRADINRRGALDAAAAEWTGSGRDADYLFTGKRLAEYERWRETTTMRLTVGEHEFLDASIARRDDEAAAEAARIARETGLQRRARRGWWALVAVLVAVAIAVGAVVIVGPSDPPTVALLRVDKEGNDINDLISEGFQRAARDFDFEPVVLSAPFTNLRAQLATLAESGADLVMFQDFVFLDAVAQISPEYPDTTWAHIDHGAGGGTTVQFAVNEAAFLAGAAAALTSISGTVGFVGGYQIDATERFRAGFEAGARAINPAIEILARYTSLTPEGFDDVNLARETAITMYREGADVVLHAAGFAGTGVFAAARNESVRQGRQLWAIGADSDEYLEAPAPDRAYILTSAIKRYDVAVYDLIRDYLEGGLEPGVRELALTDGAVGYSTTGGNLSPDTLAMLDQLENDIVSGALVVPRSPTGDLGPPPTELVTRTGTVTYDGVSCRYDGPVVHTYGELVHIDFVNDTSDDAVFALGAPRPADHPQITAPAGGSNEGYIRFEFGPNETWCSSLAADAIDGIAGPTVRVRDARRDDQAESSATSAESRQLLEDSESIARAFLDAVGEFDADRVITHLSDDAIAEAWAEPNGVLIELPVLAAIGYRQTVDACVPRGESSSITYVRCFFDLHALGSAELGLDPYRGNYWDLGLRDGKIVSANSTWTYDANGFAVQVWEPFASWIAAYHPGDVAVMYSDAGMTAWRATEESVELWEQRTREYVAEFATAG